MARRKLRGRKRKLDVRRDKNGHIIYKEDVVPHMVLVRRSEISGLSVDDRRIRTVDLSSALGRLHVIGIIGAHHRDAGLRLSVADRQWSKAIGAPPPHAKNADLGITPKGKASEPPIWEKARKAFDSVRDAISPGIHWSMLESVIRDDVIPPYVLEESIHGNRMKAILVEAFDQLAKYYGLTKEDK